MDSLLPALASCSMAVRQAARALTARHSRAWRCASWHAGSRRHLLRSNRRSRRERRKFWRPRRRRSGTSTQHSSHLNPICLGCCFLTNSTVTHSNRLLTPCACLPAGTTRVVRAARPVRCFLRGGQSRRALGVASTIQPRMPLRCLRSSPRWTCRQALVKQ